MIGIFTKSQLPADEFYHGEGLSKADLDLIHDNPYRYAHKGEHKPTRGEDISVALRAALLEPEWFASKFVILDGVESRSSAEYKKHAKLHGANFVFTEKEGDSILGMFNSLMQSDDTIDAIGRTYETGVALYGEQEGVTFKVRLHYLSEVGHAVYIKKAHSIGERELSNSVGHYRYHVLVAMVKDAYKQTTGYELQTFTFLCVEPDAPFMCRSVTLDDVSIEFGRQEYQADIAAYAGCQVAQSFGSPVCEPAIIGVPDYMFSGDDEMVFGEDEA